MRIKAYQIIKILLSHQFAIQSEYFTSNVKYFHYLPHTAGVTVHRNKQGLKQSTWY